MPIASQRQTSVARSRQPVHLNRLVRYCSFAIVAIGGNIASQDMTIRLYRGPGSIPVSVLVGTLVGLAVKFVLDKRFIFEHETDGVQEDAVLFVQYAAMGTVTTAIFWSFEFGFAATFEGDGLRYLGGIIGLILGYALKYELDRRYVFTRPMEAPSATAGAGTNR